jgi:salicylate hydroxylase
VAQKQAKVAIIGGGIGGLAAALSLLNAGVDVEVYEQTRQLREAGAGIQISPNASRILHGLGLAESMADFGVRPLAWHQRRWDDGRTLLRSPLGDAVEAEFGFPHYHFHRADLLNALIAKLPPERLHVGHRLVDLADKGDRVDLAFENGTQVAADTVVGADGIHSAVRAAVFGRETPRFTGCVAYRALVPTERIAHLDVAVETQVWMGPGKHFVSYFVQAQRLLNFVAIIDQDAWTRESWTEPGDVEEVRAAYEGWHPQIRGLLDAVDETFIWGLFERPPMARWTVGRVTLLGDSCHAMLPFMAQGAAQAIEDGAALAASFARRGADVPGALQLYESVRRPRASRVQGGSTENKTRFHLPDGTLQQARDAKMAEGSTDWSFKSIAWLFGHDAGKLDMPVAS